MTEKWKRELLDSKREADRSNLADTHHWKGIRSYYFIAGDIERVQGNQAKST